MPHKLRVADVAVYKNMPGVAGQRGDIFKIARIGELVQINDGVSGSTTAKNITGTNEASTTGNKKGCHVKILTIV